MLHGPTSTLQVAVSIFIWSGRADNGGLNLVHWKVASASVLKKRTTTTVQRQNETIYAFEEECRQENIIENVMAERLSRQDVDVPNYVEDCQHQFLLVLFNLQ